MNESTTPAQIGPVQLLAIGFGPDAKFEGKVMQELANLERHELEKLAQLRDPGVITDADFEAKKKQVLGI
jgi:hypothetical protein